MIDCKITENYFSEKKRMTENCGLGCLKCQLDFMNSKKPIACAIIQDGNPQKAIEIVQVWSDVHPQK